MENIQWQMNQHKNPRVLLPYAPLSSAASIEDMKKALHFHQTLPGYSPTPLFCLEFLAKYLGLNEILVKDESYRFGLNSFKSLGSSYAVAKYLDKENIHGFHSFSDLKEKIKNKPVQTFATATDGNHGLGLAWTAKLLGQRAFVSMPKGSSKYRLEKIRELGAHAEITDLNYDDTVRYVARLSKENGWVLFQDTSWESYVDVPRHIMHGYLTILGEYLEQGKTIEKPTHVILQAGVGTFAAAIINGLKQFIDTPIVFIILEPTRADCFFQSASSTDGLPKKTKGDLSTIMAGLSCGEVNPMAWDILKNTVDCFVTCPDNIAARGMRVFGNPLGKDPRIISGESGAVSLGFLFEVCKNPLLKDLKEALKLDSTSRVFCINTEGDTDPENYRAICW